MTVNNHIPPNPPEDVLALTSIQGWSFYGSRFVSSIFDKDADYDYLITGSSPLHSDLLNLGFEADWDEFYEDAGLRSYRRGDVNLVLIMDAFEFRRTVQATRMARLLDITDKDLRIAFYDFVVRGAEFGG